MKKLYKFYEDFGRMGWVEGLFIEDEKAIKESYGSYVYLGEILGKHSDISVLLDEDTIEVVAISDTVVAELLIALGKSVSGINPMEYIEDEE